MDTRFFNAFRIAFFFLVVSLIFGAGCKSLCPGHSNYGLTGGIAKVTPDADSIKIGDTILFSCSLASKLKFVNRTDSSQYDISGISNLFTNITISSLLGQNLLASAVDSFDYLSPTIGFLTSVTDFSAPFVKIIRFREQNGTYSFSVGIIARRKGVYALTIDDIYQVEKKCDYLSIAFATNNADNHLHYMQDIYFAGGPVDAVDNTHAYCFKVY